VNVYKPRHAGTLEERVVELLETKRALADKVLGGADESWITEMDDRALRAFLSLDKPRVMEAGLARCPAWATPRCAARSTGISP
jgi:hypothetical protein